MKSLLVSEEVLLRHIGITLEKSHNFLSDRWIAVKVFQLFPESVFLLVPLESLLIEEEVFSCHTGVTAEKGYNF